MTSTNIRTYIDGTHLYLGVEHILTDEEKQQFLAKVTERNPQLQGAHVADVVDMLYNCDAYLEITEPLYEEYEEEIHALGIPRLFGLCCYLAIYLHPEDLADHEKTWEHVQGYIARWQATRCGHVWYETAQPGETPPEGEYRVARTCTLDKDHTFPVDHHDRRAPNF